MRIVWYLLTFVFAVVGILSLVRSAEVLVGGGVPAIQIFIAAVGLLLAWQCIRKARAIIPE